MVAVAQMSTVRDVNVRGRIAVVRADFNVPLVHNLDSRGREEEGPYEISDPGRIIASFPTIDYLRGKGARVVLITHLGRPEGEYNADCSVAPVARFLSQNRYPDLIWVRDCIGDQAKEAVGNLADGQTALLENVRFYKGEEANDPAFVAQLVDVFGRDAVFVGEGFAVMTRAHASTVGVPEQLADRCAGLLVQEELSHLESVRNPVEPLVVVTGGKKVPEKIGPLRGLAAKSSAFLLGGGVANTVLAAQGVDMGASYVDKKGMALVKDVQAVAADNGVDLQLPEDFLVGRQIAEGRYTFEGVRRVDEGIPNGLAACDIGPATQKRFSAAIQRGRTVFFSGPVGMFEVPEFGVGTGELFAAAVRDDVKRVVVAGGGETADAARRSGYDKPRTEGGFNWISTGGGAAEAHVAGERLPGLDVLMKVVARA